MQFLKKHIAQLLGEDLFQFLLHSGNYMFALFFVKALTLLTLPIFTSLLSPSDFGKLAILTSFITILNILYRLGVQEAVMRYYWDKTIEFKRFYGSSFLLIAGWSVFLTVALFVLSGYLSLFFNVDVSLIYIGIVISFSFVFYGLYEGFLIASKKSRKAAWLSVIYNLTIIVLAIIMILQLEHNRFYGKAFAMLSANMLVGIYSIFCIRNNAIFKFDIKLGRHALFFGLPLVFYSFSNYLLKSFDIIIINQLVGSGASGLYSVAWRIGMVQALISLALLKSWSPMFYNMLNNKEFNRLNSLTKRFASIVYMSAFILILFSKEIMHILANEEFHESVPVVPVLLMANVFVFLFSIYVNFLMYHKKTLLIAVTTLMAAVVNIGLNYWLIPVFGYKIAAYTTLASFFMLFLIHYFSIKLFLRKIWMIPLKILLPDFVVFMGFLFLYMFVGNLVNVFLLIIIKVVLVLALAVIYFRKQVID